MNRPSSRASRRLGILAAALLTTAPALGVGSAQATGEGRCTAANVRYASSSNNLYVSGPVVCTLTELDALTKAPVTPVDPNAKVWLLGANLILQQGATMQLHGAAMGGDVNELRLRSNNVSGSSALVFIRADWGTLDIQSTRVTSWDESAGGPDTEYSSYRRAFIHVRSFLDSGGIARQSRMDIADSDIGYLGYSGAEAYGLAWKVSGSGTERFNKVDVLGDVTRSRLHHNYFGAYTYGAFGMRWIDNEIDHNVQYGLDPHDDSDSLVIEGNHVHDNGNHGIICSQRCDHLTIRGNVSTANVGNGIMLHRSVVDSVVENNRAQGNSDSGIALFESHRNTIRGNTLTGNQKGLRLSVGSADNLIEDNDLGNNTSYGVYAYKGSDAPVNGDGRPKRNRFVGNDIHDNGSYAIKMGDSDDSRFEGNRFSSNGYGPLFERGTGNVITGSDLAAAGRVAAYGKGTSIRTYLSGFNAATVKMDDTSEVVLEDAGGRIFEAEEGMPTAVAPTGSSMIVRRADTGGESDVVTRNFHVTLATGGASVTAGTWSTDRRTWSTRPAGSGQDLTYAMGDLTPGSQYNVFRNGIRIAAFRADDRGFVRFSDRLMTTAAAQYVIERGASFSLI